MDSPTIDEIDFPFCPKCGNKLRKISPRNTQCDACGLDYYVNPRPCNAIIITNASSQILLVRRAVEPSKGMWDLPGGFVDLGETIEESVIREAREELGIEVDTLRYIFSGCDRYVYKGLNYHTLGFVFSVRIKSGTMKPHDDVSGFRFFAEDEIPWDSLAFPVIKQTLRKYLRGR